jgi:hypothetical protein
MGCSDAIHGWMTGRMDGTDEKLHEKRPQRPLLYVITTVVSSDGKRKKTTC